MISENMTELLWDIAETYNLTENTLFLSAMEQYRKQRAIIDKLQAEILDGDVLVNKEYVKGRENVYINPLVKELPRHIEAANKTAASLIEIVEHFGRSESDIRADILHDGFKGSLC